MHAGKCVARGRKNIRSTWSRNTCLLSLAAAQSLIVQDPEDCRRRRRVNNNDRKQAILAINKIVYQTLPKH
jgi:hypothetical protein